MVPSPLGAVLCSPCAAATAAPTATGQAAPWSSYGGDPGGSRYSALGQITRSNVGRLEVAWTYRTGDAEPHDHRKGPIRGCGRCHTGASKFETTPILAEDRLYLSTPLNRVVALDPANGRQVWRYDPKIDMDLDRSEGFISRGVAYWIEDCRLKIADCARPSSTQQSCRSRIFFGTVDARLLALDAATGTPCTISATAGRCALMSEWATCRKGNMA